MVLREFIAENISPWPTVVDNAARTCNITWKAFMMSSPDEHSTELAWARSRPTPYAKTGNMLPEALKQVLPFPFSDWAKALTTSEVKFLLNYYEKKVAIKMPGLP